MKKILSTILAITMVAVMAVSVFAATDSPSGWFYNVDDNKIPKPTAPEKSDPPAGPKVQKTSDGVVVITTDDGNDVVLDDIDDEWFTDDVIAIIAKGLMIGYPDGKFHPNDYVTVAMVYTVLARIADADIVTTGDDWMTNVTDWAVKNGIADDADPASLATRGQMVKYLASAAAAQTDSLEWALANDILMGYEDGSLRLDNLMTRAEFATILNRYLALKK